MTNDEHELSGLSFMARRTNGATDETTQQPDAPTHQFGSILNLPQPKQAATDETPAAEPPKYMLEMTGGFDDPCRLLLEGEIVVEGTREQCGKALDQAIDPYGEPWLLRRADGHTATVMLRTRAQQAEGQRHVIRRH